MQIYLSCFLNGRNDKQNMVMLEYIRAKECRTLVIRAFYTAVSANVCRKWMKVILCFGNGLV